MTIATDRATALETLVTPTLDGLGYELVRVLVSGSHQPTLQVMAERRDGSPMKVEDCEKISRALSAKLDVEDPIAGSYTLEVSSPGLDRQLYRPEDYSRFTGRLAHVTVQPPGERKKTLKVRLAGFEPANGGRISVTDEKGGTQVIPMSQVLKARLEIEI